MSSLLPLIACFALALALLAWPGLRERALPGRSWMLLRALFPSWRFFEELGHVPKVSFRILSADSGAGPWQDAMGQATRSWSMLALNSQGNLRMAENSLIEQLMTDLADLPDENTDDLERSVSYELAIQLVRSHIRALGAAVPGTRFQFRVIASVPGRNENVGEEALISSEHAV